MVTVASTAAPEWVGTFNPVSLTSVLKRAAWEHRTGDLHVVSGPSVKIIHLDKGEIAFAASNLQGDWLGSCMLARKLITTKDFDLASSRMKSAGCRFGEALMKGGLISRRNLRRCLAVQVQHIVVSLFELQEGMYSFDEKDKASFEQKVDLKVHPLLLRGIRRMTDAKLIMAGLPPKETFVRESPQPPFAIDLSKLTSVERNVLKTAREGASIAALALGTGIDKGRALRACYALLSAGLLEPTIDPADPGPLAGTRSAPAR